MDEATSTGLAMPFLSLRGGGRMPALGMGTWRGSPQAIEAAVRSALALGYRHFDCSPIYGNEAAIGEALATAIAAGEVRRDQLWITSKLWNDAHHPDDVAPALAKTLEDLKLDWLDLYLVHWPVVLRRGCRFPRSGRDFIDLQRLPLEQTWSAMEILRRHGLCRHIGVSNLSRVKLSRLIERVEWKPEVNQIERHPYLQQPELMAFCQSQDVQVTAYSPLGSPGTRSLLHGFLTPNLLKDPTILRIASVHQASAAQVLLAWGLQQRTAVIPKSMQPARQACNLAAPRLFLNPSELREMAALDRGHRFSSGRYWTIPGSPYSQANLWDGEAR